MIWLFLFLYPFVLFFLSFAFSFIRIVRKKEKINYELLVLSKSLSFSFLLLSNLIFGLLFYFLFPSFQLWNFALLFFFFNLFIAFLEPGKFFLKILSSSLQVKEKLKFAFSLSSLFLFLFLEAFAFNAQAIGADDHSSTLEYSQIISTTYEGDRISIENGTILTFPSDGISSFSLQLPSSNQEFEYLLSVQRGTSEEPFIPYSNGSFNPLYLASMRIDVPEDSLNLRLEINYLRGRVGQNSVLLLDGITIDPPLVPTFSSLRFSLLSITSLTLLNLIFNFQSPKTTSCVHSHFRSYVLKTGGLAFCCFLVLVILYPTRYLTSYPFDEEFLEGNPFLYYNLFDAFLHGQFSLLNVPSDELLMVSNPYNPTNLLGVEYLWDTAFYNGKYYCYYGPAPLFITMFPVYFLTGQVPNGVFMMAFSLIVYSVGFFYLGSLLVEKISPSMPLKLFIFLMVAAYFSSLPLSFLAERWTDWKYRLPFTYGLMGLVWMLVFVFLSFKKTRQQTFFLTLTAFALLIVLSSRPDLAIFAILLLPFLVFYFRSKEKTLAQKFLTLFPPFVLLGAGVSLLGFYNYARFDNVLEFGSSYQLTIVDAREYGYSLQGFFDGVCHYFLTPYRVSNQWPFFELNILNLANETHPYNVGVIGIFMNPYFYGLFAFFFAISKKKKYVCSGLFLGILALLFVAGSTYSLAGVCYRYQLALWPMSALISLGSWSLLYETRVKKLNNGLSLANSVSFLLLVPTLVLSFSLAFNNFDGLNGGDFFSIARVFDNLWMPFC